MTAAESSGTRHKVLIVGVCIDGTDTGEAWSGYQWVRRLSRLQDVTLVTLSKPGRTPAREQLPDTRVIEWTEWRVPARLQRPNDMLRPYYAAFYFIARARLRSLRRSGERFDLVHQLTPLAPRYPCPAVGLGWPLVIGPLAGSIATPPAFEPEMTRLPWYARLRALDLWRFRHDPWLRASLEGADAVIGAMPYMSDVLAPLRLRRFEVMSETGVERLPERVRRPAPAPGALRLLFVGRVVRNKGLRDGIRALAKLPELPHVTLDVVGDGEDLPDCRREAEALGVQARVRFHGRLARSAVDALYTACDALLFPSFREPSGNVPLEALGFGLPAIVADNGGPGWVVDESCGFKVKPETPARFAQELAGCIRQLASSPGLLAELSAGARRRVSEIALWDGKVRWMCGLYDSVVASARTLGARA